MSTTLENKKLEAEEPSVQKVSKEDRHEGIVEYDTPAYKPRKRRFGDRYDGRLLRTAPPMLQLESYLMKVRGLTEPVRSRN